MESEKQNKQNKVKKLIFEICYWVALGLALIFALIIGAHQSKTWDSIENRLSNIEETINKKESAYPREEVRRALSLRDSAITDLTNTTWTFNDSVDFTGFTSYVQYSLIFYNSSYDMFRGFNITGNSGLISYWMTNLNANSTAYQSNKWVSYNKTITFLGGSDITNTAFINFITLNATQPVEPEPEPEPEPPSGDGIIFSLPSRYDFRKWLGEVDPLTGCFRYTTTGTTRLSYDLGSVEVSGKTYTHLQISTLAVTNAINIITGYDFQNQCYLAMGGGDYYNNGSGYSLITGIWLTNVSSGDSPITDGLVLYQCPLVGARMQYESGNPIAPSDYVPATGLLCSTFELKQTAINWENYLPSDTTYTFPGLGDNLSVYDVLQLDLLNDTYLDFYSISASATGGNVFDLISNAFKVITNLASIQVIPGISLGLLVVLPITATIIIVVVKLVRK